MIRASRFLLALLAAGLVGSSLGCYSYAAVSLDDLSPGQDLRARVRSEEGENLRSLLGIDGSTLEGELISQNDGALLLYVPIATRQVGFHAQTLKQRILVPASSVLELQRRELDRGRTTLATAAVGLGIGALAWKTFSGKAGANTAPGPGDDTSQSIGRLLVAIRLFWSPGR